jgi:hypothetical protein
MPLNFLCHAVQHESPYTLLTDIRLYFIQYLTTSPSLHGLPSSLGEYNTGRRDQRKINNLRVNCFAQCMRLNISGNYQEYQECEVQSLRL